MLHRYNENYMNYTYDEAVAYARAYIAALNSVVNAEMCVNEQADLQHAQTYNRHLRQSQHVGSLWYTIAQLFSLVVLLCVVVCLVRRTVRVLLRRGELHQLLGQLLHHEADDPHALLGAEQQRSWAISSAERRRHRAAILFWATAKLLLATSLLYVFFCASDVLHTFSRLVWSTWWGGLGGGISRSPRTVWRFRYSSSHLWRSRGMQVERGGDNGKATLHNLPLVALWRSVSNTVVWCYCGPLLLHVSFCLIRSMADNMRVVLDENWREPRGERLFERLQREECEKRAEVRHAEVMERIAANSAPQDVPRLAMVREDTDWHTAQHARDDAGSAATDTKAT